MAVLHLLELKHKSVIEPYLRKYPSTVSELTFTNLFVWRQSRPVFFAEVNGCMVFLVDVESADRPRKVVFGPVLGDASPLDVTAALDEEVAGFVRIPASTAEFLKKNGLNVALDRDNADYVYLVKDLATLAGRRFHKKRNLIKQCLQEYDCTFETVTAKLVPQCVEMLERWCEARRCGHDPGLCREALAVQESFTHWESLPTVGGAIRIDGEIQAFALGEMLNPDTAVCHFEKAMPGYRGLGQLINQWFAKYTLVGVAFENREQDMGMPGLRQAKKSYYPDHMVDKYRAWFPGTDPDHLSPVEPHECGKHESEEQGA